MCLCLDTGSSVMIDVSFDGRGRAILTSATHMKNLADVVSLDYFMGKSNST